MKQASRTKFYFCLDNHKTKQCDTGEEIPVYCVKQLLSNMTLHIVLSNETSLVELLNKTC